MILSIKNGGYAFLIRLDLNLNVLYKFTCACCSSSYMVKLDVILKQGLRNISKRITSLIFLNIYTPPQHALTHIILFSLR